MANEVNNVNDLFYQTPKPAQAQGGIQDMPAMTPQLIIEQNTVALRNEFKQREQSLRDQVRTGLLSQEDYLKTIQKQQQDFDTRFFELQNKKQQLEQIAAMSNAGMMAPGQGQEASWRSVLPKDAETQMFPKQQTERTPLSPKQLEGALKEAAAYAKAADKDPNDAGFLKNQRWEDRPQSALLTQYDKWRGYIGYDSQSPGRQAQLDQIWDEHMNSHKNYKWDSNSQEVLARRSKGKLGKAYGDRFAKSTINPTAMGNPFQEQIAAKIPKQKEPAAQQDVLVISPDGQQGYVTASELKAALAEGYKRVQ